MRWVISIGFDTANKMGSCAIVVVVAGNKVYTSSVGDSQAALLSQPVKEPGLENNSTASNKGQPYTVKVLNYAQSANSEIEQKRLRS